MIEKKVKTLYNNLISIQGKYIEQAIKKNVDLKIHYKNDFIIVLNIIHFIHYVKLLYVNGFLIPSLYIV